MYFSTSHKSFGRLTQKLRKRAVYGWKLTNKLSLNQALESDRVGITLGKTCAGCLYMHPDQFEKYPA